MTTISTRICTLAAACALAVGIVAYPAHALPPLPAVQTPGVEVTHAFGSEFVTVGNVNNAGIPWRTYQVQPYNLDIEFQGRGVVPYEYRIARTEITTSQWMEFVNVFSVLGFDALPTFRPVRGSHMIFGPDAWGAEFDPTFSGTGRLASRYRLRSDIPNAGDLPVFGISWRQAAMYCNWLHNDKPTTWDGILTGAYDTSTWNSPSSGQAFTDGLHLPNAKVFLPTLDEWLKASFYDPNRIGSGQEGWWEFANRSDVPLVLGPPGVGQSSAEQYLPDLALASYTDQMSAYGLFDVSGGGGEWLESLSAVNPASGGRSIAGSSQRYFGPVPAPSDPLGNYSRFSFVGGSRPDSQDWSFRLATPIPAPQAGWSVLAAWVCIYHRRR